MKILIVNHAGMWNKGDAALYYATIEMVKQCFPDSEIIVLSHTYEDDLKYNINPIYPHVIDFFASHKKKKRDRLKLRAVSICYKLFGKNKASKAAKRLGLSKNQIRILQRYFDADFVVSRGGDNWFPGSMNYPAAVELAIWLNKKVIMLGESIEIFDNRGNQSKYMLNILSRVNGIFVRDPITYKDLSQFKRLKNNLYLFPDMAFSLSKDRPNNLEILEKEIGISDKDNYVAVFPSITLHKFGLKKVEPENRRKTVIDVYVNVCKYLTSKFDYKVILIPHIYRHDSTSDLSEAKKIMQEIGKTKDVMLVENEYEFWDYRALIEKRCDFAISGRMHPCISSISAGKPPLPTAYSHKVWGIIGEMCQLKELIIDIREINTGEELFEGMKKQIDIVTGDLEDYKKKAKSAYEKMCHDLKGLPKIIVELGKV